MDTTVDVSSQVSCLKQNYAWVGRYAYAYPDTSYELTHNEAYAIHGAGMSVVLLCSTANGNGINGVSGWTYNNGYNDGVSTAGRLSSSHLGVPSGSGIAVYNDVNESSIDLATCSNLYQLIEYLLGFKSGLGTGYVPAVYSDNYTLSYLCTPPSGCSLPSNDIASWPFWDASDEQPSCGAAIIQVTEQTTICSLYPMDTDSTTTSSFGQW